MKSVKLTQPLPHWMQPRPLNCYSMAAEHIDGMLGEGARALALLGGRSPISDKLWQAIALLKEAEQMVNDKAAA